MTISTRNARFWAYINGSFVKLTLKPNQELTWGHSEPTEEGFHAEGHEWEYDGCNVYESIYTDGRDCDGRLSSEGHYRWDMISIRPCFDQTRDDPSTPVWDRISASQRDYFAEAAGY